MEFLTVNHKATAISMLQQNGWLRKFIRENHSMPFMVSIKTLKYKMNIPIIRDFVRGTMKHLKEIRHTNNLEETTIQNSNQSFQTLCNLFKKLRANVRYQYNILIPFLLSLHKEDCILFLKFISGKIIIPDLFVKEVIDYDRVCI